MHYVTVRKFSNFESVEFGSSFWRKRKIISSCVWKVSSYRQNSPSYQEAVTLFWCSFSRGIIFSVLTRSKIKVIYNWSYSKGRHYLSETIPIRNNLRRFMRLIQNPAHDFNINSKSNSTLATFRQRQHFLNKFLKISVEKHNCCYCDPMLLTVLTLQQ